MRARPHRGLRPHSGRHPAHSHLTYVLVVGSILLSGWVLYRAAELQHEAHLQTAPLQQLWSLPTLEQLYGPQKGLWSSRSSGPSQLLLLSYYSSRASLLARLLMLMGVFAGEAQQLRIDASDRLRWWELHQLTTLNDLMLQQHASPRLNPQLARGFHVSSLSRDEREYYTDRLQGIATYLGQHKPWLIKDPRLSWFASLWLEQLDAPLCVLLVDMQPQHLALHLSLQQQQHQLQRQQQGVGSSEGQEVVSAATHLERWTNATLSSLKACFGVPTLIIPNTVLQPPLLQPFLEVLQQHLVAAGVQGTRLPSDGLLQQQYQAHLQAPTPRSFCGHAADSVSLAAAASNSTAMSRAALLQDPCNWLPPKPHTGTSGVLKAVAGEPLSEQGDSSMLPLPTQALLSALHDHLIASLAHPYGTPLQYSRTAGKVYSTYASRVKQLVAQVGAAHHPQHSEHHHSIGALIVEALRHVEGLAAEARAAGPRPRLLQGSAPAPTIG